MLKVLDANKNADENVVNLPFFWGENNLIWYIESVTSDRLFVPERLYISKLYIQEFFNIIHNKSDYINQDKCYEIISR